MIVKGKKEEKDLIIQEIDNAFQDDSKEEIFSIAKEQPQAAYNHAHLPVGSSCCNGSGFCGFHHQQ
jgi:hypothetical protein